MEKAYKVTYVLSGITKRTDLLTMENDDTESAINAIRKKFAGVWGFDENSIDVKQIISGHFEPARCNIPALNGKGKVWVADKI